MMYFSRVFAFVIISLLTLQALTLNGSRKGVRYFLRQEFWHLKDFNMWHVAVYQAFISLNIANGVSIFIARHNK